MSKYPAITPTFNQKASAVQQPPPKAVAPPANIIPPPKLKGPGLRSNATTGYVSPKPSMAKAAVAQQKSKSARVGVSAPFNLAAQKTSASFNKAAKGKSI